MRPKTTLTDEHIRAQYEKKLAYNREYRKGLKETGYYKIKHETDKIKYKKLSLTLKIDDYTLLANFAERHNLSIVGAVRKAISEHKGE